MEVYKNRECMQYRSSIICEYSAMYGTKLRLKRTKVRLLAKAFSQFASPTKCDVTTFWQGASLPIGRSI